MSNKKERHFESVEEEVKFLRKQNAGMRGQISLLQRQAERCKELDLEGDRLYEQRIAECEQLEDELKAARNVSNKLPLRIAELEQTVEKKDAFIESLQERVQALTVVKSELESRAGSLEEENGELYRTVEELRTPWWKKLFG